MGGIKYAKSQISVVLFHEIMVPNVKSTYGLWTMPGTCTVSILYSLVQSLILPVDLLPK